MEVMITRYLACAVEKLVMSTLIGKHGRGPGRGGMDLCLPFVWGISLVLKGLVKYNHLCLKA